MTGHDCPNNCPRCSSSNVSPHCLSDSCDWWACGRCKAYGGRKRWAWKNPDGDRCGESGRMVA